MMDSSSRPLVLIVEDEELIRMHAVEIIESEGFDVIEAGHAKDAIAILEARFSDVHLIFTDINMPGSMDGLQLAHFVRERWAPILILTTSGLARLTATELPHGGRFLPKPYTAGELGSVLLDMVTA